MVEPMRGRLTLFTGGGENCKSVTAVSPFCESIV